MAKLTDAWIRGLPYEPGRPRVVPDPQLPGLRVVVRKRTKRFEIQRETRRAGTRKTHVVKIGNALTMTLEKAREQALIAFGRIERGEDPRGPEAQAAETLTFAAAWAGYEQDLIDRRVSAMTLRAFRRSFEVLEPIHDVAIAKLSEDPAILLREYRRIRKKEPVGKSRSYTGGEGSALAAVRFAVATYGYARRAMVRGLPADSPASAIRAAKTVVKQPAMASAGLPAWFAAWRTIPNPIKRELILFLLLSGLRRRDGASARWSELDLKRRTLHRPRPKGGEAKAFDLPLSYQMLRCLARARRAGRMLHPNSEFIFPSDSASGHIEEIKSAKLAMTGHALRRSYATIATEAGIPEETIARLLNHARASQTSKYVAGPLLAFLLATQEKISRHIVAAARA